jgi:hypothetical protein
MEQITCREANSRLDTQNNKRLLWNPIIHSSQTAETTADQLNPEFEGTTNQLTNFMELSPS